LFPQLKYESINIRLRKLKTGQIQVFDVVRKKWLVLTPEEWVRQHVVSYLIHTKKYATALISLEKEIELNGTKKRYDIVVYDSNLNPLIIVECKSVAVKLTEEVLEQALRYNLVLKVPFVMITNGIHEFVLKQSTIIPELPDYTTD